MPDTFVLTPADLERRTRLRRHKAVATGLLLVAALVFLLVRPYADAGAVWAGFVLAAAEAAMVGGLADWFAVTALFRRPLGLPIPHTALIPSRKDALGESLGSFVGENFLSAQVVRRRLEQADVVGRIGAWLEHPEHAARVSGEIAGVLRAALEVLRDEDVRAMVEESLRRRLRAVEVGPVLGRVLAEVVADGSHRPLVDVVAARTHQWLSDNPETVAQMVQQQAPDWSPAFVDRALARRVHRELVRISGEAVGDPEHPIRVTLDSYLAGLSEDLQHDPETIERLQRHMDRLASHEATRDAVGTLVAAARRAVVELVEEPDGRVRTRTAAAIVELGGRLRTDTPVRGRVDTWLARVVEHVVTNYRDEITRTITDTVDRWDGAEAARRIELVAGPDLQYIRVNGTVVGALAGVAIHTATLVLG